MSNKKKIATKAVVLLGVVMISLLVLPALFSPMFASGSASHQLVLSCSSAGIAGKKSNPCVGVSANGVSNVFGFWIWCEPSSSNPYNTECAGSLYYLNIATNAYVAVSVDGSATSANVVTVTTSDNQITCTLVPLSSSSGPTNTISGSCSGPGAFTLSSGGSPAPGFSGVFINAVVTMN